MGAAPARRARHQASRRATASATGPGRGLHFSRARHAHTGGGHAQRHLQRALPGPHDHGAHELHRLAARRQAQPVGAHPSTRGRARSGSQGRRPAVGAGGNTHHLAGWRLWPAPGGGLRGAGRASGDGPARPAGAAQLVARGRQHARLFPAHACGPAASGPRRAGQGAKPANQIGRRFHQPALDGARAARFCRPH